MYKIIEYNEQYKNEIIDFWLEIFIDEYEINEWKEGMKETFIRNDFWKLFIAIDSKNKIVATTGIKKVENKAEIKRFCVKKNVRGQGLAKQMMEYAVQQIREEGIKEVFLYTIEKLKSAIIFYEKNGFKRMETSNKEIVGYKKIISEEV